MEQEHKEESKAEAAGLWVWKQEEAAGNLERQSYKVLHMKHGIRVCTLLEPSGWESRLKKVASNPILGLQLIKMLI